MRRDNIEVSSGLLTDMGNDNWYMYITRGLPGIARNNIKLTVNESSIGLKVYRKQKDIIKTQS